MKTLLGDIRVLDFTRVLAGPHCTKILADMGAAVDKVEPPSGDLGRLALPITGGTSHFFAQQNAGKRNISIDLNYEEGRAIVMRLAERADVIVENFRPGTLEFYGLDYASVARRNPRVVYASISGYGQDGPWRDRAGFAPTVQAEVGFTQNLLDYYGLSASAARHDLSAHADTYAGLHAAISVLAALHHRTLTGRGQHIDIAMAATMLYVNERFNSQAHDIDTDGEPTLLGAAESPIITMADGTRVTIAGSPIYTPIFRRYCMMMRRTDLLDDARFATAHLRREHQGELYAIIRSWMLTFTEFRDLEVQVRVSGMALGTVRSTQDFLASDWARHRQSEVALDDGQGGRITVPRPAWLFSNAEVTLPTTLSSRGADNAAVLAELGLSEAEIARLVARGVLVADAPAAPPTSAAAPAVPAEALGA
jgi:crotonobetainyl-CoA:carnitine CoA-transferase CaiB-like acyl-CoA transferase